MAKKQENKYSMWCLTVQKIRGVKTLPSEDKMKEMFERISASKWLFQLEVGEKKKEHYQCGFMTKDRTRSTTLLKQMYRILEIKEGQLTLEVQNGSWAQNVDYCSKPQCRVGNAFYSNFTIYNGFDVQVMQKGSRRPFQQAICNIVLNEDETDFKPASDRAIYWITDRTGCSGKSRLVKWFLYNFTGRVAVFACNTDNQLRGAAIEAGPRDLIFVDLSRATKQFDNYNDKIANVLAAIEDLKNGMVSSAMYGHYRVNLTPPPHVFIFSNQHCPSEMLSYDRWREFIITDEYELKQLALNELSTEYTQYSIR